MSDSNEMLKDAIMRTMTNIKGIVYEDSIIRAWEVLLKIEADKKKSIEMKDVYLEKKYQGEQAGVVKYLDELYLFYCRDTFIPLFSRDFSPDRDTLN